MPINKKPVEEVKPTTIKEFIFNPEEEGAFEAISLVTDAAVEVDFRYFSKDKMKFAVDEERRVVTGPFLIPDKLIYRIDGMEEFYGFFSKYTIELMVNQFMKEQRTNKVTLQHEKPVDNVYLYEIWLVNNPEMDKAKDLGFDVPVGTAMCSMKVLNDEVWNQVKNNEARGFSIESYLGLNKKEKPLLEQIKDAIVVGDLDLVKKILLKP